MTYRNSEPHPVDTSRAHALRHVQMTATSNSLLPAESGAAVGLPRRKGLASG